MRNRNNGSRLGAAVVRPIDSMWATPPRATTIVAVLLSLAIASQCSAQTLNLGPDSSYGVFANGGTLTLSASTVKGGLDASSGTSFSKPASTITGSTNLDATAHVTNLPSGNLGSIKINGPTSETYSAASTGTVSVFNLSNVNLVGETMNLKGAAGDTFIFNVSGSFMMTGVNMVLSGIDATHIVFISNNAIVTGSNIFGTFYNGGSSKFFADNVTGAIVEGNKGNLMVSASTISASPFASGATIAAAPETPTILTAALGAFLIMGSSGFRYLRRRRCASCAEFTAH
jgi:hypothetical protein